MGLELITLRLKVSHSTGWASQVSLLYYPLHICYRLFHFWYWRFVSSVSLHSKKLLFCSLIFFIFFLFQFSWFLVSPRHPSVKFFFFFWFQFFQEFFFVLVFHLILVCLSLNIFEFILFWICSASLICRFMFLTNLGNYSCFFFKYFFSLVVSLSGTLDYVNASLKL